jgi:hypothetical protein
VKRRRGSLNISTGLPGARAAVYIVLFLLDAQLLHLPRDEQLLPSEWIR